MKILIAEDDVTSRLVLASVLKKAGHEVVETVDGAEAWRELQKPAAPQLAILDWMMPEMDGLEVVRRVREIEARLPPYLIMLTSKGDKADIVAGLDAGADDYLAKPFDRTELQARIKVGERISSLQASLNEAREIMERQAMHDPLTGLPNRRGILLALEKEISRAGRLAASLSIGLCDIDHFKKVNDTHGHLAGDDVLRGFAQRMQGNLRKYDLIGRYGGEEFLVVAAGSSGSEEESLYHRLCTELAGAPISTREGELSISVSIGVVAGGGDSSVDQLLAAADAALYRAKDGGRNRVVFAGE